MKIGINKSAKRVLSITLALVMLLGTLFTANIGVTISAGATTPIAEGTIDLLEFGDYLINAGSTSKYYDTVLADNGETGTSWDDAIIIDSAEEFAYLCKDAGNNTDGKYYKVADGIAGFDLSAGNLNLDGTLAENLEKIQAGGKNHGGNTPGFQGYFDGNGITVYGAVVPNATYGGLFSVTKGDVIIKNINVTLSSFKATYAVGGIVGYHVAEGTLNKSTTLTIENCTVTDCYFEVTTNGWGRGLGAIAGRLDDVASYKDTNDDDGDGNTTETIYVNAKNYIKNCFVDLDEQYFISKAEDGVLEAEADERAIHGGVAGFASGNALSVSDCIVLGIRPYATTESTKYNDVQHSGLESHYSNVYTDTGPLQYAIGGTLGTRDFTNRIFILTTEQMQGAAAVGNMNLAWFSVWKPGAEGQYPTFVKPGEESGVSFWTGTADAGFAGGTGTETDPFIIETADQLYYALTNITYTTSTTGDLAVETAESVAGGTQTSRILKQGSTTVYVPVYTPYYYKVADGVDAFYLNNVYGNETLAGAKAMVAAGTAKDWKPGKSFVGHLDGNGVTIYGMYSSAGQGLVYKLDGASTVKNINFNACYASGTGNSALLTTNLGSYSNDSTRIKVANISVRNSYIATTRNITLRARTDTSGCYDHDPGPAGIISTGSTPENVTISNSFFDGMSCERAIGAGSEATIGMMGGIYSGTSSANNFTLSGCVSLDAPLVNEVYVSGKEVFYNRYDKNGGFEVFFYNNYTNMPLNEITTAYPNKYDKLSDITRIETKNAYADYDMPKLSWSEWTLVTEGSRTFPMPTVNTAEEIVGSYVEIIGRGQNNYAGTGPYKSGSNPYTYLLKGAGTEADPYIIETAEQLARAIATGGMNLYDRLYYRLDKDIDLSGGAWINQTNRAEGGIYYTYTPFGGQLDGNGHVITGLSAGDNNATGLIPVLASGGVVKNIHVRNSAAVSSTAAGIILGEQQAGSTITGCSAENCKVSMPGGGWHIMGNVAGTFDTLYFITADGKCLYVDESAKLYGDYTGTQDTLANFITNKVTKDNGVWYMGGSEGSMPRLVNLNSHANDLDVAGDGKADGYGGSDLTALRNKLLRKSAYANINGDVSRNGIINIADLAVLQRSIVGSYGEEIGDSFFANVESGMIKIYYGENDNYDAARKVELYLEALFPGLDVQKCVSTSKGTVKGANSDAGKVYLHEGDIAENPDGKLDIIIGDVVGYSAESGMAANTYEVTYDSANKVVWLKGQNFTAVEQAAINFVNGSKVQGDTVYTCGATELEDYKKPVQVTLDTDYDGSIKDTSDGGAKVTTLYYAWGDEFDGDTIDTYNWEHNTQQTEGQNGSDGSYNNLEIAPVKDLNKVITVTNGRLSMKRGHDKSLGGDVSYNGVVGSVALDVTPGEFNGYTIWDDAINGYKNAIDTDGSDKYFASGKLVTQRGMLYKQGYIEFQGQIPADGHAFPAWWLMGRPSQTQTNAGYDYSLYSKVYKLNDKWNGENVWDKKNLDTYKYQIPSAIYEIDMMEVMQHSDRHYSATGDNDWGINIGGSYHRDYSNVYKTSTEAVYMYFLNTTIHKWWNNGVDASDNLLYIADWDNYKVVGGITNDAFKTTSTAGSWIHNIGSTKYDFGSDTLYRLGKYYYNTGSYNEVNKTAHNNLTQTRRYGFSWNTNGTGFEATLYIYNADGSLMTTVPIASGMSELNAFKDGDKKTEANGAIGSNASIYSDAKVFNQYMYILFDNKYYSSNENSVTNGSAKQFTDLLTSLGLKSFEIDYVRVYQEDGYRDIVTPATQNFNNNNHFGYN